jgi:uncharacterized 2Fe-2S/4Fe-4S cluster protein (DUF4445 family)
MPSVRCLPSGQAADVASGTELLDAVRRVGAEVDAPCGGKGTCGKCVVRVAGGEVDSNSLGMLSAASVADGYVLACRTRVLTADVIVEVPQASASEQGKFSDTDDTLLIRGELLPRQAEFEPLAIKWLVRVPPPRLEEGLSDLDRLTRAIQQDWGKLDTTYPLAAIRTIADAVRAADGLVTVTLVREAARVQVVRVEPGDTTTRYFGIAVDIGTTTVAVHLIDLCQGRILCTRTAYNGQVACGLDVISRINYARRPERLNELKNRVLETINRLIRQGCASHGVEPREVCDAVLSGNTTMSHLLLGLKPEYIRLDPYVPTVLHFPYMAASAIGIEINPDSWVYLSPCVGSYVGGDITAGALCTDLATDTEEINLFVDIGTNGELVVGNRDFLMTCACSAGPAFEGGGIDCGMRAAVGAIEQVQVDPQTGIARCSTIGHVKPRGICGSGMIGLLAELFLTGWIDAAGRLERTRPCPAIRIDGKRARYVLAEASQSATGQEIAVSETDIDNILRAKAAIYSACALMVRHLEMEFTDLAHVYIAGGFGRFLDLEKAIIIGLIPDIPREKFHYIGNSSLTGSYMVAISQDYRRRQLELAQRMTCIELSRDPAYMDQYTAALFLPHTDPERFPSVHAAAGRTRRAS